MKACYACGHEWTEDFKPGFSETCENCDADMHVCLNCSMYDATLYNYCKEPMTEKVAEVDKNNRCPFFDFKDSEAWKQDVEEREASKKSFENLFEDS